MPETPRQPLSLSKWWLNDNLINQINHARHATAAFDAHPLRMSRMEPTANDDRTSVDVQLYRLSLWNVACIQEIHEPVPQILIRCG